MTEIEILDFHPKKKKFSILETYGEKLTEKTYITNPAIAREQEIEKLLITLLTPEKSGLLVGKAGIGKTAIVEGLAYKIQEGLVPPQLKNYEILKINSTSLIGMIKTENGEETIMSLFLKEIKTIQNTILFIDEIHTLIGARGAGPMDLANMLKPVLDRGDIKLIGATTTEEYHQYVIRDRAFLRRFERVDIDEPSQETTVKILLGTLPKIASKTGINFNYGPFLVEQLITAIVEATTEYKRIYGLAAMYPDVSFSVLTQAFSVALIKGKQNVEIDDVYNAIKMSKRIYPDSIIKELDKFRETFKRYTEELKINLPIVKLEEIKREEDGIY